VYATIKSADLTVIYTKEDLGGGDLQDRLSPAA